ncbi:MAG: MotA/TolQ/ExbB proton channel family protein [Deltaproteobacteria bacterium]|nr:MotA/TolQ/ExbB proton channel family protein [Deltaproteobacteria bacterium]
MFFIVSGIGGSLFLILLLTIVLSRGSPLAKLLLNLQSDSASSVLPYPITIQNIMWIMLGVAIGDSVYRFRTAETERKSIELQLLPEKNNSILTSETLPEVMEKAYVHIRRQNLFLARLIHSAGMSFQTHANAQQSHEVMSSQVDLELHRLDLRYTLIRYIAWLLPTLGFIGTVVGISSALASIDVSTPPSTPAIVSTSGSEKNTGSEKSYSKNSTSKEVTNKLGLAFNTTILALIQSIVVVLLSQFLQKREEEIINEQSEYCLNNLIVRLYNPDR